MNYSVNGPLEFFINIGALLIAITVHEFSHAFAADQLGDPTPRLQGRLTLNPLSHLDPLGTLMLLLVHFGWGKPVQFDPFNLRNPRRDSAIISLAGPAANLVLAVISAVVFRLLIPVNSSVILLLVFLQNIVIINVILMVFNLVPIHPLDGFKIVGGFLSDERAREWYQLERYGMILLLFLLFPLFGNTAPIQTLISPPINYLLNLLLPKTPLI